MDSQLMARCRQAINDQIEEIVSAPTSRVHREIDTLNTILHLACSVGVSGRPLQQEGVIELTLQLVTYPRRSRAEGRTIVVETFVARGFDAELFEPPSS